MKRIILKYLTFTFIIFILFILNVKAAGQCYDCNISDDKGWYSWSEDSSNPNAQVCRKSNLSVDKCIGTYDHSPKCFYCKNDDQEYYKWSDNGINPNSSICSSYSANESECHKKSEASTGDGIDMSGNDKKDNFSGGGGGGFCTKTSKLLKFFGKIFKYFRILVPVFIIIFASIDMFKAVTAQKEDEIKKASESLVKRLILSVLIFFVPTFVSMIFNLMGSFMEGDMESEYKVCASCILAEDDCP